MSKAVPIARTELLLRLHHGETQAENRAQVLIDEHRSAQFLARGRVLEIHDLRRMRLNNNQAWDIAAENAIRLATQGHGLAIRARPSQFLTNMPSAGLQIDTPGSLPSGWLAHPRLHRILERHFAQLLGSTPIFYAPDDTLVLLSATPCPLLEHWISQRYGAVNPIAPRQLAAS
ncbi:hypothetical protein [Corynebacterium gerontici]|uniref:Uncharacterized protein n=1 Tax=Corynebacterium gerontici TaxID=2079234 RepID=A0A3G6J5M6_9CORY|nr:hypothetical protein [Corynebacterium gerontici]AZA11740.1 hypothetical protein CGERO_07200 [Corynebacterium gerontici]